ncbi:hypothetical protein Harreka1_10 [Olleya phage Harreka_1]|uniref:Uncharacterized protein n=1 Tax=Olleya phage Harreka_1 TaxID=2745673 RepID=A0A8E5EBH6_9CAUD|nr:hypothetical protein M1M26_gp10 [Olleya phage Harreka_1]QQV90417.1 hypothetical protein Harreka1_10 [Olleya phage Harreka_1]
MKDFSFIRLKDNFADAKNVGDSPVTTHPNYHFISLSPNEAYMQISNVSGGISFTGEYNVYLVDCNDSIKKDITSHIFIDEFTDVNGSNQIKFEIVNINKDFYRETLYFKFTSNDSNVEYWSNPLNVTDYQSELTTYFEYENYYDFEGICYSVANCSQSIRLQTYFDIPVDESEVQDYFQVTRNRTISARALIKKFEQYKIDGIYAFAYERLNLILKHDLIYVDGVRMTNKTTLESSERQGLSNLFESTFIIAKDYEDTKDYSFQLYGGLDIIEQAPLGDYTLSGLDDFIMAAFNTDIEINTGTLTVFDALTNDPVRIFNESDMYVTDGNIFNIDALTDYITENGEYFIMLDSGLIVSTVFGTEYEGVNDNTEWAFSVSDGDFSGLDFNNNDFFTN